MGKINLPEVKVEAKVMRQSKSFDKTKKLQISWGSRAGH